ncbi:hypothetical protein [Parabacteroides sp. PM5-20]|uniref:hypothetical protein n=1 Tax=Parabacteroides sp. PM5-20 TaxID=2940527 RepID=UPI00247375C8|nr:hypothetical protein [Parabacteroides sp. PM5-20]
MKQKRSRDFRTLLHFLKTRFNEDTIRQELVISGIDNPDDLDDYISLALRSYQQVLDWIEKNGNNTIRHKAGL